MPVRPRSNFLLSVRHFSVSILTSSPWLSCVSYCGGMTSYRFFKMAVAAAQYYSCFRICWCLCPQKVKVYQQNNNVELLLVWKNKRSPYWNSASCFDLDHFPVICILFSISLPNFVQIGAATAENDVISLYQDGGRGRLILFPVSHRCPQQVKIYQQTKFRRYISMAEI